MNKDNQQPNNSPDPEHGSLSLVDELGVHDLRDLIFGKDGKLFSAAGRDAPVAELTDESMVLHPPQIPLEQVSAEEYITPLTDASGILLNELGVRRKIIGAKFHGHELYWLGELAPNTSTQYLAGWLDEQEQIHKLYLEDQPLTCHATYKLRNQTFNGELSFFGDLKTDV